jgi:hypothetical protein
LRDAINARIAACGIVPLARGKQSERYRQRNRTNQRICHRGAPQRTYLTTPSRTVYSNPLWGLRQDSIGIDTYTGGPQDGRMSDAMFDAWDQGQRQLAAGQYPAARDLLQTAEAAAWAARDAASLARIWLPLLEACRQIRYLAAEGRIEIHESEVLMRAEGGIEERLVLLKNASQTRLASVGTADYESGLPVEWVTSEAASVGASTDRNLVIPLPPPGIYDGRSGLGAVSRESILIAWEALALAWQQCHPMPPSSDPWAELAWLRQTLQIDPACEPAAMRLIAVAEGIERSRK